MIHLNYVEQPLRVLFIYFVSFSFRQQRFLDGEFSRRCLTFFIDLVTEFCFSREDFDRIEPEVIQKIMGYVFYSAEKKNEKNKKNKSIFTIK